jgi:uncharacterized membrane protein
MSVMAQSTERRAKGKKSRQKHRTVEVEVEVEVKNPFQIVDSAFCLEKLYYLMSFIRSSD